jgi:hypothetical protein
MPLLDYYQRYRENAQRKESIQFLRGLQQMLSSILDKNMSKIFSLSRSAHYYEQYQALSALTAYYFSLKKLNESPASMLPDVLFLDNPIPDYLHEHEQNLIKQLILEQKVTLEDIQTFNFTGTSLLDYLAKLPFPLNIKCLSEALNNNTPWKLFFDTTREQSVSAEITLLHQIRKKLIECNVEAFKLNNFCGISPELATVLGNPDLGTYIPIILYIFKCESLSESNPSEYREWIKPNYLNVLKEAIRKFINALPDQVLQEKYLNHPPVIQIFNMEIQLEPLSLPRNSTSAFTSLSTGIRSLMRLSFLNKEQKVSDVEDREANSDLLFPPAMAQTPPSRPG